MKRVRRWIFNAIAAISLLLCAAAITGWIQSYVSPGEIFEVTIVRLTRNSGRLYIADSTSGELWISGDTQGDGGGPIHTLKQWSAPGLEYCENRNGSINERALDIKYWLIVPLFAGVPFFQLAIAWRRRKRTQLPIKSLCKSCGYDLRATPNRCPECGTIPQTKPIPA